MWINKSPQRNILKLICQSLWRLDSWHDFTSRNFYTLYISGWENTYFKMEKVGFRMQTHNPLLEWIEDIVIPDCVYFEIRPFLQSSRFKRGWKYWRPKRVDFGFLFKFDSLWKLDLGYSTSNDLALVLDPSQKVTGRLLIYSFLSFIFQVCDIQDFA